jgi:hypothetical protein
MAEKRDARGRRRVEGQERGLRPLYPRLPLGWVSRALRVSMPEAGWRRFDALLDRVRPVEPTEARAAGQLLMGLMEIAEDRVGDRHWLDWEREKALHLLRESRRVA